MGVGFCFFVKWVLHLLRGIIVQEKKKKKKVYDYRKRLENFMGEKTIEAH